MSWLKEFRDSIVGIGSKTDWEFGLGRKMLRIKTEIR